jgi:two-component system response regulator LytT
MNILVLEDDQKLSQQLCDCISLVDASSKIVNSIPTVKESVEWLKINAPDLIFMDIRLADGNCFEIFDNVEIESPVVFCTAFDNYATKAFDHNGIAYLLKPVTEESVARIFKQIYRMAKSVSVPHQKQVLKELKSPAKDRFFVQVGTKLLSIETEEISHFYASEKLVFLVDIKGNPYIIDYALDYLETVLPRKDFFRINRKFIVSYKSIQKMSTYGLNRVKVQPKVPVTEDMIVSVDRTSSFKLWLDGFQTN